jgi:uncharacterized integral membrane protein
VSVADDDKPVETDKAREQEQGRERAPEAPRPEPAKRRSGVSATLILGILLPLLVIILASQNTNEVQFEFLWWDVHAPLVVLILGAALAGVVISQIAALLWRRRQRD